ncbi:MAG: hypothetical protein KDJ41_11890 [Hyphomicrobiaceae bacterium]|nr:hypothetical protein [Hyphomicrobiaceae bacterium]
MRPTRTTPEPARRLRAMAVAAVLVTAALAGLLVYQGHVERQVAACLAGGGQWEGPWRGCRSMPRPILRRDLHRV